MSRLDGGGIRWGGIDCGRFNYKDIQANFEQFVEENPDWTKPAL